MEQTSNKIRMYIGSELTENIDPPKPIIDGILWEKNAMMFLGTEKSGKSIACTQMFKSIVSGEPFLDIFEVKKQGPVVYIQSEGDDQDFHDRLERMCKTEHIDESKFCHIFKKFLPLEVKEFKQDVFNLIDKCVLDWGAKPVAICLDSTYKCFSEDLISNEPARRFTNIVDEFIDRYDCAMALIHHESKESLDEKTKQPISRGDKGAYGSVFLRAYVDHILFLKKTRNDVRQLTCDTQRSGLILKGNKMIELTLIEPDPLKFIIKGDLKASSEVIYAHLSLNGNSATIDEICQKTGLHRNTVSPSLTELLKFGRVKSSGKKPKVFSINKI